MMDLVVLRDVDRVDEDAGSRREHSPALKPNLG
jgi:hypothetical protein